MADDLSERKTSLLSKGKANRQSRPYGNRFAIVTGGHEAGVADSFQGSVGKAVTRILKYLNLSQLAGFTDVKA
jgi:hypothetical protein